VPRAGFERDVAIIGGCGRVGLPLGIAFASKGLTVTLVDMNRVAVDTVNCGLMPFREDGADKLLQIATSGGLLVATTDPASVRESETVVVVVGTPLDKRLRPDLAVVPDVVRDCAHYLSEGQLLVLRSTVAPGVTRLIERELATMGLLVDVAFCPERIAEGLAMTELFELPQIVGARTETVRARAAELFRHLTRLIIDLEPEEAELAKLFTNAWRYVNIQPVS